MSARRRKKGREIKVPLTYPSMHSSGGGGVSMIAKYFGRSFARSLYETSALFASLRASVACKRHGIGNEMVPNWDARWSPTEARRLWRSNG